MRSVFFFSSRRRHTRFDCDWSSDVCSSDLEVIGNAQKQMHGLAPMHYSAPCARLEAALHRYPGGHRAGNKRAREALGMGLLLRPGHGESHASSANEIPTLLVGFLVLGIWF